MKSIATYLHILPANIGLIELYIGVSYVVLARVDYLSLLVCFLFFINVVIVAAILRTSTVDQDGVVLPAPLNAIKVLPDALRYT